MEIDTYIHIYKIFTYVFVYTHTQYGINPLYWAIRKNKLWIYTTT